MAVKYSAKGSILKSGSTAAPTTSLASVKSIGFNIGARALIDATTHDNSGTKAYVDSGLKDTSELQLNLLADPDDTAHEAVRAAHAAGTPWYFTLVLPNSGAAQWALLGIILEMSIPQLNVDGLLEYSVRYKATAGETFTQ